MTKINTVLLAGFTPWATHTTYVATSLAGAEPSTFNPDWTSRYVELTIAAQKDRKRHPERIEPQFKAKGVVSLFVDDDQAKTVAKAAKYDQRIKTIWPPLSIEPLLERLFQKQNWRELKTHLDFFMRFDPDHPVLNYYRGQYDLAQGYSQTAATYFEWAISGDPTQAKYHAYWGRALHRTLPFVKKSEGETKVIDFGVSARVIESLKMAIALEPDRAQWWSFLGQHYQAIGEISKARYHLRAALRLDAKHVESLVALSKLEINSGDDKMAMRFLKQIIALRPRDLFAHINAAIVCEHSELYENALERYMVVRVLSPKNRYWCDFKIAQCYEHLGQLQQAAIYYARLAELDPENHLVRLKAQALQDRGFLPSA